MNNIVYLNKESRLDHMEVERLVNLVYKGLSERNIVVEYTVSGTRFMIKISTEKFADDKLDKTISVLLSSLEESLFSDSEILRVENKSDSVEYLIRADLPF